MSALAVDAQGRVWAATAEATDKGTDAVYLVTDVGATPLKVVTDVHTPLGLLWVGDTLYVSEATGVVAFSGFDGTTFATRTTALTVPDGTGEVNGIAQGGDGRLYVGVSAPCDDCTPTATWSASVISFLPDGSDVQVVADGIRAADRAGVLPRHQRPVRHHEPARRPRRQDPGRLARRRERRAVMGVPRLLRPGRPEMRGGALANGRAREACSSERRRDRHRPARPDARRRRGRGRVGHRQGEVRTALPVEQRLRGSHGVVPHRVRKPGAGTGRRESGALFVGDWTTGALYRITA